MPASKKFQLTIDRIGERVITKRFAISAKDPDDACYRATSQKFMNKLTERVVKCEPIEGGPVGDK